MRSIGSRGAGWQPVSGARFWLRLSSVVVVSNECWALALAEMRAVEANEGACAPRRLRSSLPAFCLVSATFIFGLGSYKFDSVKFKSRFKSGAPVVWSGTEKCYALRSNCGRKPSRFWVRCRTSPSPSGVGPGFLHAGRAAFPGRPCSRAESCQSPASTVGGKLISSHAPRGSEAKERR